MVHVNGTEAQPANQPELQQPASRSAAIRLLATLGLMESLPIKLARLVLTRVLSQPCESRIPRSGNKGEAINCYVTAIDRGADPYLIVQRIEFDVLSCIEWDGSPYSIERSIPLSDLALGDLRITHYYGLSEILHKGIVDYLLNRLALWP